ncbi:hypothetical protein GCM10009832_11560 [Dietzia kunjamensis subsp. schimae]
MLFTLLNPISCQYYDTKCGRRTTPSDDPASQPAAAQALPMTISAVHAAARGKAAASRIEGSVDGARRRALATRVGSPWRVAGGVVGSGVTAVCGRGKRPARLARCAQAVSAGGVRRSIAQVTESMASSVDIFQTDDSRS